MIPNRRATDNMSHEEQKQVLKEAMQEWLDAKYSEFGKWTLRGVLAAALVMLATFLSSHGYTLKDFIGK